jgi:hypothetical protein
MYLMFKFHKYCIAYFGAHETFGPDLGSMA